MARLSAGRRAGMPKSSFAGPGRSFPINDPLHARLAIGGATRAERAGNISASTAASIKAKARDKLGGANDVSHGSKSGAIRGPQGNKAGGPITGKARGGGQNVRSGNPEPKMGSQSVPTRGGGKVVGSGAAGFNQRNGGGANLNRAGGPPARGKNWEGSRADMAQDRALAARKGTSVDSIEGSPEDEAMDRRMSGRPGARDGMGGGAGGMAIHSSAGALNIGGYEPQHTSKRR